MVKRIWVSNIASLLVVKQERCGDVISDVRRLRNGVMRTCRHCEEFERVSTVTFRSPSRVSDYGPQMIGKAHCEREAYSGSKKGAPIPLSVASKRMHQMKDHTVSIPYPCFLIGMKAM